MRAIVYLCLVLIGSAVSLRADEKVRQVQEELRKRNLYFGNVDGQESLELTDALKRYQRRKGFEVTGAVDNETAASLHIESAVISEKQQNLPDTPVLRSDTARALPEPQRTILEKQAEENPDLASGPPPPAEAPAPGQNLTPERVTKFVADYLRDAEREDVPAQIKYYAFPIEYFDHGTVDKHFVVQDTSDYVKRWPERKYTLIEPVRFFASGNENETTVEFTIAFELRSPNRTKKYAASGRTKNWWTLHPEGDELKIIAIREQRLRE